MRLFDGDIDPSVPTQSIYTIKYRVKSEQRLFEKLEQKGRKSSITADNYAKKIEDILGLRIVCLRLSDVEKIEKYLTSLNKEGKLIFVRGPARKQTFVLPVNPGEGIPRDIDLQYSGYSSIHYVVKLGKVLRPAKDLASLMAEVQVRTILEEAWGEIDHKYRYEIVRRDVGKLPDSITRGFYNFSAYLQAAALQAEYLCRDVEQTQAPKKKKKGRPKKRTSGKKSTTTRATSASSDAVVLDAIEPPIATPAVGLPMRPPIRGVGSTEERIPATVEAVLRARFGFSPTERLAAYVKSRLRDYGYDLESRVKALSSVVAGDDVISTFIDSYREVSGRQPFSEESDRDIDVITAVNYGFATLSQPKQVARAGLMAILRKRFGKSVW